MMELKIDLDGLQRLQGAMARFPAITEKHMSAATHESLMLLQREIVERTPTGAHQLLRKSIISEAQPMASGVLGVVGTSLGYAEPVELGTKPHFPPVEPLVDWVVAKLGIERKSARGVAFLIARKISITGTEGAYMFHDGFAATAPYIMSRFERAAADALAEISAGGGA